MIGRFKSALLNAVSNTGLDASVVGLSGNSSRSSGEDNGVSGSGGSSSSSSGSSSRKSSRHIHDNGEVRTRKYEYTRPHFLHLVSSDEITVSADHAVRPIIVPRDLSFLPWESGYAETINSGKSKMNEDQARVHYSVLRVELPEEGSRKSPELNGQALEEPEVPRMREVQVPYFYFGVFDGHAGAGAAVAAAARLHVILHEKLQEVGYHLVQDGQFCETVGGKTKGKGVLWFPQVSVTKDSLIVGALEAAFHEMDEAIREDNLKYEGVNGGCTAVICLFILGKVYTANAGDSRAIYCMRNSEPVPLSQDFTPETERTRVRLLAAQRPELLGTEFTSNEYLRRPVKKDLGTKILYRAAHMTGWAYKTATVEDLKFPVVFGHGKRSRVLATIGVTRGFGDHELYAHSSSTKIKPFLSSQPEVKILDLNDDLDEDSVIVMGTDGLWDVTANLTASRIVFNTLDQFPPSDKNRYKYRYVSAAQDLVMHARGKFNDRNWKMSDGSGKAATIDDISVFVIPIGPYMKEWMEQICIQEQARLQADVQLQTSKSDFQMRQEGNSQTLPDLQNSNDTKSVGESKLETNSVESHETAVEALENVINSVINGTNNLDLEEPNH